jgi:streptogramin lyase
MSRQLTRVVAFLLLTACSGSTADTSTETSTTASSPTTASPTASPSSTSVDVETIDATTISLEAPDWMAAGFGSIWVHQDSAEIARIDPATDEVETVRLDEGLCQGIAAGLGAVWTCEVDHLARLDPDSGAVDRVDVQRTPGSGRFPIASQRVWVLTGLKGDRVSGVSTEGRVADTIELPFGCTELSGAADGDMFWVACEERSTVLAIDAAAGEVVGRHDGLEGAIQVLPDGDDLWVVGAAGILRVDPTSGEVIATIQPGPGASGSITLAEGVLWSHAAAPFLLAIDPSTNDVVREISSRVTSGGDVIAASGFLWVSQFDGNLVTKIPLDAL